jgi:hypothetical protein
MAKLTDDPTLAEIFPPEDLAEYNDEIERQERFAEIKRQAIADSEALAAKLAAMGYAPERIASMSEWERDFILEDPEGKRREERCEAKQYPPPLTSAELKSTVFPPRRFLLDKLIMEGIPQTIDGDGGIGKSTVIVGASVAIGAGVPIFGKRTIRGPVLFVTHEDDLADLQSTARAYADYLDVDLATLPVEWWSLLEHDITLAVVKEDGSWEPGPFYDAFKQRLSESPRGLFVVLDCRSDVVQMNEFLREPPNTFYKTVLTPLCKKYGCTILVLCHPSKASMADGSYYSGGTGNKSALRNKLVMKLADETPGADPLGPRMLDVLKRNRGARDKTGVRLSFDPEREIFVADDDADVQRETAKQYGMVIEQIRTMLAAGVVVQVGNTGSGQGPREVAAASGVPEKQVKSIMKAAIRDGLLGYHSAKPGGRIPAGFHLIGDPAFEEDLGE